ncbi:hypothetical protein ACSUZJ_07485 [Telluria sp. B2]
MMDFHLATPDGDVYLFSYENGRIVDALAPPQEADAPDQHLPHDHLQETFTVT